MDAAIDLLLAEGLKGLTHRQVAAAASVPVGSIGYYYSTRDKLVATCFEQLVQGRLEAMERAKGAEVELSDPVQLAEAVVDVVACGQTPRASAVVAAFIEAQRETGKVGDYVRQSTDELKDLIAALLQRAGVDFNAARVLQIVVGTALTERHENAPVAAVADLLRLAEK
nr:TetR family transcriptional regulator [Corynebacterium pilbarense]